MSTEQMSNASERRPAISCIIPVFNGKRDLKRAVNSVLDQRADVQVVLVEDGSTDGSTELVVELARSDSRILPVMLPQNRGQGSARNIGVAAATSTYITFLDQDDEHIAGWYDYAIAMLDADPSCAAIKGGVEFAEIPAELNVEPTDPRLAAIAASAMWNVVARKVAYQAVGGCPATRPSTAEDIAFMSVLGRHFTIVQTDYPSTLHYVRRENGAGRFLRRTRLEGAHFVFLESVPEERTLGQSLADFVEQSDLSVGSLRATLKPDERTQ